MFDLVSRTVKSFFNEVSRFLSTELYCWQTNVKRKTVIVNLIEEWKNLTEFHFVSQVEWKRNEICVQIDRICLNKFLIVWSDGKDSTDSVKEKEN